MGGDPVEFIRSIYAPWKDGDFSHGDWADPEIEFSIVGGPAPGTWYGAGEMARVWGEMLDAFEDLSVEAEQYLPLDGQRVLVLMHNKGRGKTSGVDVARIAAKSANLWGVRNGKVTKLTLYWSRERALDELGIDPALLERGGIR